MNQALSGGAVALVLAVLWLLRRPRPQLMRSTDGASVAALNRAQMELVVSDAGTELAPGQEDAPLPELGSDLIPGAQGTPWPSLTSQLVRSPQPRSLREVNARLAVLKAAFAQGGQARRQAMETCLAWSHRAALPLLHLGLRDADPVVAALAARGLDRFRGRSGPSPLPAQAARLPRNVARTR